MPFGKKNFATKEFHLALTSAAQLVGHHPAKGKVTDLIPGWAHTWVVGLVPDRGMYERQPIDVTFLH